MKTVAVATLAALIATSAAAAGTTIYKYTDESGRVTYSNKPIKGATVVELEPLTTIPTPPAVIAAKNNFTLSDANGTPRVEKASLTIDKPQEKKPVAIVTPIGPTAMLSIDAQTQRKRDDDRRRILEQELSSEQQSLDRVRASILEEQQNPQLVAAVRAAQQAADPSPSQMAQLRGDLEKASGRIRGLQATATEHEQNVDALKKELAALR
jgi:hypothetical protein